MAKTFLKGFSQQVQKPAQKPAQQSSKFNLPQKTSQAVYPAGSKNQGCKACQKAK